MLNEYLQFEKRKQDHIELALRTDNQTEELNSFDQVFLIHEALPDIDFESISIKGKRFGEEVLAPFIVSSMTAGHQHSLGINRNLIAACKEKGWAMGVGSQRRELMDPEANKEWRIIRKEFPKVSLMSNIGIAQLITASVDDILRLTETLEASALIVHCNPLQECIQPEGTPVFKGSWQALEAVSNSLEIPIIVKETGCGFSLATLKRLNDINIAAVDVSGLGGTHWGRIEGDRADENSKQQRAADTFRNWGIDTVSSVKFAASLKPKYEIWGSGGVRQGLDAAKLLALGASTIGFAKPMLVAALKSAESVVETMDMIEYELKVAMFCTGSRVLSDLKENVCH